MGFNVEKFETTKYKDRTAKVPVPELKKFFEEGDEMVWTVKCVGANEIAQANKAHKDNMDIAAVVTALSSGSSDDKAKALKEVMGLSLTETPGDVVRRISLLVSASVEPVCDQPMAVRLSTFHGTVFYRITNKILELMGEGMLGE